MVTMLNIKTTIPASVIPNAIFRNVWTFPDTTISRSSFCYIPEALPERCIKAATPEYGCCDKCGKPYERIVENKPMEIRRTDWGEKRWQ